MDLAFIHYPQHFKTLDLIKLKQWTAEAVKKAKKVIVISRFTKKEVARIYQKKISDIVVVYPAITPKPRLSKTTKIKFLKKQKLKYSYRFLFVPATIGAITWLSKNEDKLDSIKFGLVLALLGDTGKFNYKKSRTGNTSIDKTVENILRNNYKEYNILDFSPYGYDERQYCSPGYNLPIGRISRTPHGQYPEYHTSADDLNFVKQDKLVESVEMLLHVFSVLEKNMTYLNLKPKGEPQLGKRGLFRGISGQSKMKNYQLALLWVLNLSDGNNSLLDISDKSQLDFNEIKFAADVLENVQLIKKIT